MFPFIQSPPPVVSISICKRMGKPNHRLGIGRMGGSRFLSPGWGGANKKSKYSSNLVFLSLPRKRSDHCVRSSQRVIIATIKPSCFLKLVHEPPLALNEGACLGEWIALYHTRWFRLNLFFFDNCLVNGLEDTTCLRFFLGGSCFVLCFFFFGRRQLYMYVP